MRSIWTIVTLLACATPSTANDPALPTDGRWAIIERIVDGASVATEDRNREPETVYEITGKRHRIFIESKLWVELEVAYRTDIEPMRFEATFIRGAEGAEKIYSSPWRGIFKVENDEMTRCYFQKGNNYPAEFRAPKDSKAILLRLKKIVDKAE